MTALRRPATAPRAGGPRDGRTGNDAWHPAAAWTGLDRGPRRELGTARSSGGAPRPGPGTRPATEPRHDPGNSRFGETGRRHGSAPPPELDEPHPDDYEHAPSAAAPPRARESAAGGLLQRIAAVVAAIPPGRVATYGQVAAQAGNRRAARQVAWALRAYAGGGLPWHRVIGAGGVIRLPGEGLQRQRALLLAEGVAVDGDGRLDLAAYQWRP